MSERSDLDILCELLGEAETDYVDMYDLANALPESTGAAAVQQYRRAEELRAENEALKDERNADPDPEGAVRVARQMLDDAISEGAKYKRERDAINQASQPRPPPQPSEGPAVWDLVIADMSARDRVGRERYGTPLQPHNGRDALIDAYQESLDLCVYLRQAICERDGR